MEQTIADLIQETFNIFGQSVAETFAQSFSLERGYTQAETLAAQETIDRLTSPRPSHSQALADLISNATVIIPNTRSSGQAREKRRSVD